MYYKDSNGKPFQSPTTKVIEQHNLVKIDKAEFDQIVVDINTPTTEQLADQARSKRDGLLRECDYIVMPDYPLADKSAWETYRQALRDITAQVGFPTDVTWPTKPSEV